MFGFFARKRELKRKAAALYAAILAQSRNPDFYASRGVPDTFDGRFDSLLLHAFLVFNRLQAEGGSADDLNQTLFDAIFRDAHQSLRQIGVGDLSVPRHMKRMMQAFKGRSLAYQAALGNAEQMEQAVRRNLFGTVKEPRAQDVKFFADYIRVNAEYLAGQPDVAQGVVVFKDMQNDLSRMVA